jgi:flagellin-like protein
MRKAKTVWHKNDDAVSPVIGTILMVAITVVLAAVLWLMVSGMISSDDDEKTTINLAAPQVSQKSDNATRWNVRIDINKITPKDVKVLWTEAKIIVKSSTGSVLDPATDLLADTGGPYANTSAFYYVETTSGDTKLGAGDGLKLTGLTQTYEGATVELTKGGERIASATLPTNFP